MRSHSIVIVEDDIDIRDMLARFLEQHGMLVRVAPDWATLRTLLADGSPDLLILDITLPDAHGFNIMRWLRERQEGSPPIIIVTGATSATDRIAGLDLGADDYVCKPFDMGELLSRVRAVLRRSTPAQGATPAVPDTHIRFGPWLLKRDERVLIHVPDQRVVELTSMEFDLLSVMAQRPNRVLSRDDLLTLAHTRRADPFDRAIDVRITRLRRKIEANPNRPGFIRTVRGAGYMFHPDGAV